MEKQRPFKKSMQFVKTVVIGGLVFLVPLVMIVLVIGKAFAMMLIVANYVDKFIPVEAVLGVALVNIVAILGMTLTCFLAGLYARTKSSKKIYEKIETFLLGIVPGYTFVKGLTDSLSSSEKAAESFFPVIVRFDDYSQLCFEIERTDNGLAVVYVPGAPNSWSGSIVCVTEDRIDKLDMTVAVAMRSIKQLTPGVINYGDRPRVMEQ
jgi:uncharacterized membrane protein